MKIKMLVLVVWCLLSSYSKAQDGSLDLGFGNGGKVTTAIGNNDDSAEDMCVQPDGKILLVGSYYNGLNDDFALVCYNSDGSLDLSFGNNGKVTTAIGSTIDQARAVSLQPDGKILVAGLYHSGTNYDFALVRYNNNGSLDLSFGNNGKIMTAIGSGDDYASAISLQPDGKILVAGNSENGITYDFALARYNSNGSLDLSFDIDGKVTTSIGSSNDEVFAMSLQPDGKILLAGRVDNIGAGYDFALARYNSNGSLDLSFGNNGKVTTAFGNNGDYGYDIYLQPDGKILVAGGANISTRQYFALTRYNTNGSLDLSFDNDGRVTTAIGGPFVDAAAHSIKMQPNGKIIAAGYSMTSTPSTLRQFVLVRYNTNGSLDLSFDTDGIVTTSIGSFFDIATAMCLQSDEKILVAGYSDNGTNYDFALARYNNTITPINKIENPTQNLLIYPNPFHSTTTIEFGTDLYDAELTIYNVFGQKVKTISNISDSMIRLNRDELGSGFYVVCLVQDKKVVATGKLVVD